ncbi:MAG: IS630 family transposase [Candidatus Riesia sp.]|nr:IS630 family transposase [Candidatus Riesia sp.]
MQNYKSQGKIIVYTDESGFVENAPRTHGYSIKGERCYGIHDWHPSKRTNVIGALIDKTLLTVSLFDCNINSAVFNCWVGQDLIPKLPNNSVIVMDNAAFHKNEDLKTMVEKAGHIIEYLPPYSPDLNPIEPKWFQAKSRRRKYLCDIDTLFQKYIA